MIKILMPKVNINDSLKKLAKIVEWFEEQEQVDVEVGLEKVREGAQLIKGARERLKEIENEFGEVKRGIEQDTEGEKER